MANLLANLSRELKGHFDCSESLDQFQGNLSTLAEQLQLLITAINQHRFLRDSRSPDIGIGRKIKLIECLAREATQIFRNVTADTTASLALDKQIRQKRRVLKKLKRSHIDSSSRTSSVASFDSGRTLRKGFLRCSNLSPIRESIPLPPPSPQLVRFRMNNTSRLSGSLTPPPPASSTIDTDVPLEFDLVPIVEELEEWVSDAIDEEVETLTTSTAAAAVPTIPRVTITDAAD